MDRAAITAPAASRTWEAKTRLLGSQQETGRIELPFRGPVHLVAARPTIAQLTALAQIGAPSLFVAGLDDVEVYIDVSERTRYTSRFDLDRTANSEAGQFVTLSNFIDTVGGARILDLTLTDPAPVVGINFRWARPIAGGPYFSDVLVGLALHCYYLSEKEPG